MLSGVLYIFAQNSTLGIQLHVSAHAHIAYLLVKFIIQPDDDQYTEPKHVVVYPMYYCV
jgi:hypothetical protein